MKIWIYPKDGTNFPTPASYYEITPYISNEEQDQKRSDDAFAITTFKAIIPETLFSLVKFNIAPFTIFEISPTDQVIQHSSNIRYFGYSKCTPYLREQLGVKYYVHDITLIEPTAILEAIQIGTKTFTNHWDIDYVSQLCQIIKNTRGINISPIGSWTSTKHSYSWDKGTTAYEVLNDIFKINNWKIKLSFTNIDSYPYLMNFNLEHIVLSDIPTIALNENNLSLVQYNQNFNEYCRSLESQVDNVIDRNTTTTFNDLVVKADGNADGITKDNCYLELPTKVEDVKYLSIYTNVREEATIFIPLDVAQTLEAQFGLDNITWANIKSVMPENQYSWFYDLVDRIKANNPNFNPARFLYTLGTGAADQTLTSYIGTDSFTSHTYTAWFSITKNILKQSIYESLTPSQQPTYCYFATGSNYIKGIYKYYKDGWIQSLVGGSSTPMLEHCLNDSSGTYASTVEINANHDKARIEYEIYNNNTDPTEVKWQVEANTITNQYVLDKKDDLMNDYKNSPVSRSYGNSANFIDYDIMKKNISISNKGLGTPELTLQFLNTCDLTANSKFVYGKDKNNTDITWYVRSIVMDVKRDYIVYTVNATTNYDKQADCIGVRTQYQATKIALDNIKERHLYFTNNAIFSQYSSTSFYMEVCFAYTDGTTKKCFMPCALYYAENLGTTLVVNFKDNYSAMTTYAVNNSNMIIVDSNRFIQQDYKYCDDDGEVYAIKSLKIVHYSNSLSMDEARKLPRVPQEHSYIEDVVIYAYNGSETEEQLQAKAIYKDEHESLSFTIYLPNVTILY